jgi:hypothetical protein
MRGLKHLLFISAMASMLTLTASVGFAQTETNNGAQRQRGGRQRQGNFDPAQFQQRMMERYRERLEITDDAEWKAVQPLIQNVMDARVASGGRGAPGRGGRRGGEANSTDAAQPRNPGRTNAAADELQKAVDGKVPAPEMKAALTKYMDYRKSKQADLEKAQAALRAVLTSRQEAIAALSGLL